MTTDRPADRPATVPASDAETLDAIQWMLRDPEWGVGMLEDIADRLRRNGRTVENLPDPEDPHAEGLATWVRH
jgi:hypothetical protein